jgi:hypothetical protein
MVAFLPPSSSESFLKSGAADAATARPVSVPPVKDTARTNGCVVNGVPISEPRPCTTLKMPGGAPAAEKAAASAVAVTGVISDGFATTVLPMISAGATFHVSR